MHFSVEDVLHTLCSHQYIETALRCKCGSLCERRSITVKNIIISVQITQVI